MSQSIDIVVPDLGDFDSVPVIEILVTVGDEVAIEDPLITLESDKATMDVPSSAAGRIGEIRVALGDTVSTGDIIAVVEGAGSSEPPAADRPAETPAKTASAVPEPDDAPASPAPQSDTSISPGVPQTGDLHAEVLVLGSGPGGYTAAFRAADLGKRVVLVERYETLGGVCLNVGCIPSKALLHAAKVIAESEEAGEIGLKFNAPEVDLDRLRTWKESVVGQLTGGLAGLAKQRKVEVVNGTGRFVSPHELAVERDGQTTTVSFDQAIIAAGSEPVRIPGFPHDDPRVIDSTGALQLDDIPERLLIVGGGIIGLEMATVYHALGSRVSVVEMLPALIAGADPDLVRPLQKRISRQYENIWLNTRVSEMKAGEKGIEVTFDGDKAPDAQLFDRVLVSVGRTPNGQLIGAEAAGVTVTDRGFIEVDDQMRTNVSHIFAIGDIIGQPMLAHKAVHEGKVAAEVAAGMKSGFDARVIPSVAYTDPEIAWVGVTETEAKEKGLKYGKGAFPWAASGRSLSQGRKEGVTKLLFDEETDRVIGAGITGNSAGDLIAEAALAIEMNADASDIGLTIHAHPTLAETLGFAAEAFEGTITDLYLPRKKK